MHVFRFIPRFVALSVLLLPQIGHAQTLRISTSYSSSSDGNAIATRDPTPDAAARCEDGMDPVVISSNRPTPASFFNVERFMVPARGSIGIRRAGVRGADSENAEPPTTAIRSRDSSETYRNAVIQLEVRGCLSPLGMTFHSGTISVVGRVENYTLDLETSVQALGERYSGNVSVYFTAQSEIARFGTGEPRPSLFGFNNGDTDARRLGVIAIEASDIEWTFPAIDPDARALQTKFTLRLRFPVVDGGVALSD